MSTPGLLCRADADTAQNYFNFRGYFTSPLKTDNGWILARFWWRDRDFIMSTGHVIRHQGQDWHQWLHIRHNVLIWFLPVHLEAFYQV